MKLNRYTRAGEAEAPIGEYTDTYGTTIRIYPDKNNHVLIEIEDDQKALSVEVPPGMVTPLRRTIAGATRLSEKELLTASLHLGSIDPTPPTDRAGRRRHERLLKTNAHYRDIMAAVTAPGASFHKPKATQ